MTVGTKTDAAAARAPLFAVPDVEMIRRTDGTLLLRSKAPLPPHPRSLGVDLCRWADVAPERPFLAERQGEGWRKVSYGEALAAARAIGQGLLARGLSAERPVLILAENGVDHALLMLAGYLVGVPVVPVSTAYSKLSRDYMKLKGVVALVEPGLVYVDDATLHGPALAALPLEGVEVVASAGGGARVTPFAALQAVTPGPEVAAAFAAVGPETVAKILFTSGSTGLPKGVCNTHGMLAANQSMLSACWPFLRDRPPVIVDWLPWNHTFGGNHNFNMVLRHGGTLWIDDGKPAPPLIGRTVANLRKVSPTVYFNVPRGYAMLLDVLEADRAFAETFFRDLAFLFYAGAALPQVLWERLEQVSRAVRGAALPIVSSWGLTETAPLATAVHFRIERAGNIGVPAPGCEVKLVPDAGKLEIRVRGPHVTPGYWRAPEKTAQAFDDEGFYRTGDAVRLADPENAAAGLLFDGRIGENFKLLSGTWVTVGELRVAAIAALAPVAEDIVVTGHDRDEAGALVFPNLAACRRLTGLGADVPVAEVLAATPVREAVAAGLARLNKAASGTSGRIGRALLLAEPPSPDGNEVTDKGYLNQRAILARRADLVARLYADPADPAAVFPA